MIWLRTFLRFLVLAICGASCVLRADASIAADFEAANKLYEERKFPEAVAAYERIVQSRVSSRAVYFNLGNAYFKSGQIGRAIASYHQAQRLSPRDGDVQANLRFARNQVQGPTVRPSRWENILGRLTLNEWTGLTVLGAWTTFVMLSIMLLKPSLKLSLRSATAGVAGATVVLAICLVSAYGIDTATDRAVLIKADTVVHNGPFDDSPSAFTAQDGAELRIIDRKDDWYQVTDGSRRNGWLRKAAVVVPTVVR